MWGGREEAQPAVKDKVGQGGLEDEGRDPSPPVAVALQCVPKVFYKKLPSVQLCPAWLEVCWKSPTFITHVLLCLEQPNCCRSQNLLLLSNGRGIHLKGPFRRKSQNASSISTYFTDLFVLASEIPVRNEHLMAESLIIFLKRFMAAFPILEINVCVRVNKNISMMVSRYKRKATFCVLTNHM